MGLRRRWFGAMRSDLSSSRSLKSRLNVTGTGFLVTQGLRWTVVSREGRR